VFNFCKFFSNGYNNDASCVNLNDNEQKKETRQLPPAGLTAI